MPMPPCLRLLITLLMLLAMPLKGIAALGMAGCAAGSAHLQGHHPSHLPTQQQSMPCHEASAAAPASQTDDSGSCAHCAACLTPLWAAPAAPVLAVAPLAHDWPPAGGASVAGYSGAVPQPPPRR